MSTGQGEPGFQMIKVGTQDLRLQPNRKGQQKDARKNLENVQKQAFESKLRAKPPFVLFGRLHIRSANSRRRSLSLLACYGMQ
jgi:hypothetical protein